MIPEHPHPSLALLPWDPINPWNIELIPHPCPRSVFLTLPVHPALFFPCWSVPQLLCAQTDRAAYPEKWEKYP